MQGARVHKIFSLLTRRGALAVLFSGFFCAAGVAGASALEDGQNAYAHRDFDAALKLLQPLAKNGDAQAQAMLGLMYNTGQGVPQDFESAIRWWRLSAAQGNALAQVNLGLAYGIQQKFARAYVWLSAAAAQSYPNAAVFRSSFADRMTKQQLAQAQAKTQQCLSSDYKLCE